MYEKLIKSRNELNSANKSQLNDLILSKVLPEYELPYLLNLTQDLEMSKISEETRPLFEKMLKELVKQPIQREDLKAAAEAYGLFKPKEV